MAAPAPRVLVGLEFSGVIRRALRNIGIDAWSCDLEPALDNSPFHLQRDVREVIFLSWDMGIFHPVCTRLCNSGVKHLYLGGKKINGIDRDNWMAMREAAEFFRELYQARIPRLAIENPVMHGYAKKIVGVEQTQTIQPWQFGHGEIKRTCWWLKNLPKLVPTKVVSGRVPRVHHESPGMKNGLTRPQRRSITYAGIGEAIADQWGRLLLQEGGI